MLFVTAATPDYVHGVVALHHSLERNLVVNNRWPEMGEFGFACIAYGDDVVEACAENGIWAISGESKYEFSVDKPEGRHANNDAMYVRLLLPYMFPDERRIVWLDCDQVAVADVSELAEVDTGPYPCAMVDTKLGIGYQMSDTPGGVDNPNRAGFAGLIVIDCEKWHDQAVTERCLELMANPGDLKFNFVVQSVLNYVLDGAFMPLDTIWQGFGNRPDFRIKGHKFVHWHGRGCLPWLERNPETGLPIHNREIWGKYR